MALLKKVKASTLMETLVASVLVMIVFFISGACIRQLVFSNFNKTLKIEKRQQLKILRYFQKHIPEVLPTEKRTKFGKVILSQQNDKMCIQTNHDGVSSVYFFYD